MNQFRFMHLGRSMSTAQRQMPDNASSSSPSGPSSRALPGELSACIPDHRLADIQESEMTGDDHEPFNSAQI
jgi:hypothetical protein